MNEVNNKVKVHLLYNGLLPVRHPGDIQRQTEAMFSERVMRVNKTFSC